MKVMDIFCASPASTAICSSMDHHSMLRHPTSQNDRYHQLHGRQKAQSRVPCSSQLPIIPKPYFEKSRKSSAKQSEARRKSSADIADLTCPTGHSSRHLLRDSSLVGWCDESERVPVLVRSQSAKTSESFPGLIRALSTKWGQRSSTDSRPKAKTADPYSTLVRAQYGKTMELNSSDSKPAMKMQPFPALINAKKAKSGQLSSSDSQPALKSSSSARSREQVVVVLRVSIHCKGCEKKIRKHISKMEGVASFTIDFASKKVIIKGDVTPLGVLASVSKVKSAELWQPSPT